MRRRPPKVLRGALGLLLVAVAACGGDDAGSGGAGAQGDREIVLDAPAGTDPALLEAAAPVVENRLERMGVTVVDVKIVGGGAGLAVRSDADPWQLRAAAQQRATTIVAVGSSDLGPCEDTEVATVGVPRRCHRLDATLTGVEAVTAAEARATKGAGWEVGLTIDGAGYSALRAALAVAVDVPVAVVGDDEVLVAFYPGTPGLASVIGPGLSEEQARAVAAALLVADDLQVALVAPPLPEPRGARVDEDFWTAALGVEVCGSWLPDAPSFGLDTGLHSHGDGLVYVHPMVVAEAGDRATLGLFLDRGGWVLDEDRLDLWDGSAFESGDACADGGRGEIRWWVDGERMEGDPSAFLPRNGQVIVVTFNDDDEMPGLPPQMDALGLPRLGAAGT